MVVPVRDERDNILPLLEEIRAVLEGRMRYEVIYVDDGSRDGTRERLIEAARAFPALRVLRHVRSCGQSSAIRTGVRAARAAWVATLDGDGQNDPSDIPRLYARALGPDPRGTPQLVGGHRRERRDDPLRRLSSRVANAVRSRLLHDHDPDTGCGLKLFSREVFLDLPYFDHMHRFLAALVIRHGGRAVSVDVHHRHRRRGRSKYGVHDRLWVGIVDLLGVMWLQRRARVPEVVRE